MLSYKYRGGKPLYRSTTSVVASRTTRNGFVHLTNETQTPPEGTGLNPLLLWSIPMKVTYRGVPYDTNIQRSSQTKTITVTYRGITFIKEVKSWIFLMWLNWHNRRSAANWLQLLFKFVKQILQQYSDGISCIDYTRCHCINGNHLFGDLCSLL